MESPVSEQPEPQNPASQPPGKSHTKGSAGRRLFIEQVVSQLKAGLGSSASNHPNPPPDKHYDLVMMLYTQYSAKFTNDNNKIWATGTLFIPLSLAGLLSLKDLDVFQTLLLGAGSVLLVGLWVLVEESHRAFQNKSQAMTEAIERYIGLDHGDFAGPKLDYPDWLDNNPNWLEKCFDWKWLDRKRFHEPIYKIKSLRWLMLWIVSLIWLAAIGDKCWNRPNPPPPEPCACCQSATTR